MTARRKKDSQQTELPIEGAAVPPVPLRKDAKEPATNGNGESHVLSEDMPAAIAHRPFDPKKHDAPLHKRVDRGFLDYASYVIRDRAIPNLGRFEAGAAAHPLRSAHVG